MDFAIDQEMFDDGGLVLETVAERYSDDVMARFARSPEGSAVLKACDRFGWAALVVDYGMRCRGVNIAWMHRTDLDQILFEVLPREFSARPEEAAGIVTELRSSSASTSPCSPATAWRCWRGPTSPTRCGSGWPGRRRAGAKPPFPRTRYPTTCPAELSAVLSAVAQSA